ncbi:MAG TPA: biopolymer transporter ExbD [Vicinamibacterales bacterium]|jgi:biopolymer transport protein ExbD|nr:biopolymer transporter ExbD [Vicinamibacterales bacterium]
MPKVQAASSHSSGRGARGHRVSTSLAEINVVPLVDVMLVLLIIFMVTAPLLQRGIDVKLPTAVRATAIQGERIFIDVPLAYRQDRVVYMANEPIKLEILQERMRQKMENQSEKQVYLRIEGTLQVQDQMDVIDRLKAAGVQTIGIVAATPKK